MHCYLWAFSFNLITELHRLQWCTSSEIKQTSVGNLVVFGIKIIFTQIKYVFIVENIYNNLTGMLGSKSLFKL